MSTQRGSYEGKPTIELEPQSKYPFKFGVFKAHMILENLEDIKAFCRDNPKQQRQGGNYPAGGRQRPAPAPQQPPLDDDTPPF